VAAIVTALALQPILGHLFARIEHWLTCIAGEFTCEMSQGLRTRRFEAEGAATAADIVRLTRARFGERAAEFARLTRVAAVSVNGVIVIHGRGLGTKVANGGPVMFVKASAGG
jgi:hypothetical protein